MQRSFAIGMGAVVLGAALVVGGAHAEQPGSTGSGAPPGQTEPGMIMPHGAKPHGGMPASGPPGIMMPSGALAAADVPSSSGQDTFAAISEIMRILDADVRTDWTKVDLERLRQHLIDMHEVVLRAQVTATPVEGGLAMDVTGHRRTADAIRAMVGPHAGELGLAAKVEPIPGGVHLTVTAVTRLTRGPWRVCAASASSAF